MVEINLLSLSFSLSTNMVELQIICSELGDQIIAPATSLTKAFHFSHFSLFFWSPFLVLRQTQYFDFCRFTMHQKFCELALVSSSLLMSHFYFSQLKRKYIYLPFFNQAQQSLKLVYFHPCTTNLPLAQYFISYKFLILNECLHTIGNISSQT